MDRGCGCGAARYSSLTLLSNSAAVSQLLWARLLRLMTVTDSACDTCVSAENDKARPCTRRRRRRDVMMPDKHANQHAQPDCADNVRSATSAVWRSGSVVRRIDDFIANSHRPTRHDATRRLSCVVSGGVNWLLLYIEPG